jgi:hypothetical protein
MLNSAVSAGECPSLIWYLQQKMRWTAVLAIISILAGGASLVSCDAQVPVAPSQQPDEATQPIGGVSADQPTNGDEFDGLPLQPTIASIVPPSGLISGGTAVTISGTNFLVGLGVQIGSSDCIDLVVSSSTEVTCITTASEKGATVSLTVTNSLLSQSTGTRVAVLADAYTYEMPTPTISSVSPAMGPLSGGTALTIIGTNFAEGLEIKIGNLDCDGIQVLDSTLVNCITSAAAYGSLMPITLTNAKEFQPTGVRTASMEAAFTFLMPPPTISTALPSSGPIAGGTAVAITGTNFLSGLKVFFGATECTSVVVQSVTEATCVAPAGATAGAVTVTVTNSAGSQPTGIVSGSLNSGFTYVAAHLFNLYFASQTGSTSVLSQLSYDSATDAIAATSTLSMTSTLGADGIRLFMSKNDGGFLVGGTNSLNVMKNLSIDPLAIGSSLALIGRPSAQLPDLMGGCVLANGNIIASSYGSNLAAEYDSSGNWQRNIPSLYFFLINCIATGAGDTLYAMDYDANSDQAATVRKYTLAGGVWTQVQTVVLTTFNSSTTGSGYAMVLNSNGHLYLPPQNPETATGGRKVIRCSDGDLTTCAVIGGNWPIDYDWQFGGGAVEGAVQIPGTTDMLFIDSKKIYRYHTADNTMTAIYTLAVPGHAWTRNMHIRAAP